MVCEQFSSSLFRSVCVGGLGILFLPLTAFSAPSGFLWDPNTESDLVHYKVYQGESPGQYGYSSSVGLQNKFYFAGLQEGRTYFFSVTAVDSSGNESPPSAEVKAVIPDSTPPTPPTNVAIQASSSTGLQLIWAPSQDNIGGVEYVIFRGNNLLATTTTLSYTDTPLEPDTDYYYTVQAVDSAGNSSAMSDVVLGRTATDSRFLQVSVSGGGAVTSSPQGLVCTSDACQTTWSYGQSLSLTAKASRRWIFMGWGGACTGIGECVVVLHENTKVFATFEKPRKGQSKKGNNKK